MIHLYCFPEFDWVGHLPVWGPPIDLPLLVGLHRRTIIPHLTCLCCPPWAKKRNGHPYASCGFWALTSSRSMSKPFIIRQQEHSSNSKTYADLGLKNRTVEWWRFSAALSAQCVCRAAVRLHAAANCVWEKSITVDAIFSVWGEMISKWPI